MNGVNNTLESTNKPIEQWDIDKFNDLANRLDKLEKEYKSLRGMVFLTMKKKKENK